MSARCHGFTSWVKFVTHSQAVCCMVFHTRASWIIHIYQRIHIYHTKYVFWSTCNIANIGLNIFDVKYASWMHVWGGYAHRSSLRRIHISYVKFVTHSESCYCINESRRTYEWVTSHVCIRHELHDLEADWLQIVKVRDKFTSVMEIVTDSCVWWSSWLIYTCEPVTWRHWLVTNSTTCRHRFLPWSLSLFLSRSLSLHTHTHMHIDPSIHMCIQIHTELTGLEAVAFDIQDVSLTLYIYTHTCIHTHTYISTRKQQN